MDPDFVVEPELEFDYNNIEQHVGYQVCVSVPGGRLNPASTTHPVTAVSSTTTDTYVWTPFNHASSTITSTITANAISVSKSGIPILTTAPLANDTRLDCYHYDQPPILTNFTADLVSSSCADVAAAYNVTTDDLILWNPSLNITTGAGCTLDTNYRYCVLA